MSKVCKSILTEGEIMRRRLIRVAIFIVLVGLFYLYEDNKRSFSTPLEAIYNQTDNMEGFTVKKVFASSEVNNRADYFYITNSNNIVAAQLSKGWFGWRSGSLSTGSGLNINDEISEPTSGYTGSGDFLFGLTTEQVDRIEVNGIQARLIPLDLYIEGEETKGKKLWYVHIKTDNRESIEIRAYDKLNKEL
ncbi:hypothetical protein AMS62_20035 [Bacillus sp. FJAT-18019]|nr:hypothetical protein AMS62_20035 [Bacillus sp. FJAT-18019]